MRNLIFGSVGLALITFAQEGSADCFIARDKKVISYSVRNANCVGSNIRHTSKVDTWEKARSLAANECKQLNAGDGLTEITAEQFYNRCFATIGNYRR